MMKMTTVMKTKMNPMQISIVKDHKAMIAITTLKTTVWTKIKIIVMIINHKNIIQNPKEKKLPKASDKLIA